MSVRVGVVTFPGSCDDRDALRAIELMGASRRSSGTPTTTCTRPTR
jgi:phosphoribosylformylglycinamidine (FGAM) synthase-like amidotransferase family enzyme